jgi:hypothetical protein
VTIALIDVAGLRSEVDIATDITTALTIWNTGTEMDEAAAIGISQPPRALPGQGDTEGVSETRHYSTTRLPYWNDTIRVTLEEVADDEWRRQDVSCSLPSAFGLIGRVSNATTHMRVGLRQF